MANIVSDTPKSERKQDRLDYYTFAESLAKGLMNADAENGLTIGLYGAWGIGKTTVLNFVKSAISDEDIVIVDFNPWWFSGREDLARALLEEIEANLTNTGETFEKVTKNLGSYIRFIGRMAKYVPEIGSTVSALADGMATVAERLSEKESIVNCKKSLSEALIDYGKRIIIFIDDIDRLCPEEIAELFRVIKTLADFPNVIYVAAFDKEIVSTALSAQLKTDGEKFLQKIIQVDFSMPSVEKDAIADLLYDAIFQVIPCEDLTDTDYWREMFVDLQYLFCVPRDVLRLKNTLSVTYPAVRGDVNVTDFVAIEALRIQVPEVYEFIKNNLSIMMQQNLIGHYSDTCKALAIDKLKTNLTKQYTENRAEHIIELMQYIFPQLVYSKDIDNMREWTEQKRICSDRYCDVYFRFSFPLNRCNPDDVKKYMINDDSRIYELIRDCIEDESEILGGIIDYLKIMRLFVKELTTNKVQQMYTDLFNDNDALLRAIAKRFSGNACKAILSVLISFCDSVTVAHNITIDNLNEIVLDGNAYAMISFVSGCFNNNNNYGAFIKKVLRHFEEKIIQNRDFTVPFIGEILPLWYKYTDNKNIVKQYCDSQIANNDKIFIFFKELITYYEPMSTKKHIVIPHIDIKRYAEYVDFKKLFCTLEELRDRGRLSDEYVRLLEEPKIKESSAHFRIDDNTDIPFKDLNDVY